MTKPLNTNDYSAYPDASGRFGDYGGRYVAETLMPNVLALETAWREANLWALETVDIRDFARDKHRSVDDTPFGGGPGMVMRAEVIDAAIAAATAGDAAARVVYLSPRGRLLTQAVVRELAALPGLVLLCGRYEGVDERVLAALGART